MHPLVLVTPCPPVPDSRPVGYNPRYPTLGTDRRARRKDSTSREINVLRNPPSSQALNRTAVLLGMAVAVLGCRAVNAPAAPTAGGMPDATSLAGPYAGPSGVTPAPGLAAVLPDLPGRIVAIAAVPEAMRNRALAFGPSDDAVPRELWTTPDGANVSDWSPAPDGRRVAYRVIQRSSPTEAVESIVVRALDPRAAPITVASIDTAEARLAGFVWIADGRGRAVAYLVRVGPLVTGESGPSDPPQAWELHRVDLGAGAGNPADHVVWRVEGESAGAPGLLLVGWDAAAERAALAEIAGDSGLAAAVRVLDTSAGTAVQRVDVSLAASDITMSPDGHWLALSESVASPPTVRLLELSTGDVTTLARSDDGARPGKPLWSPDGAWLAWLSYPADGADDARVMVMSVADKASTVEFKPDGYSVQPLAFSPDSRALLLGVALAPGAPWERLTVLKMPAGDRMGFGVPIDLPQMAPYGAWQVSWVP